MTCMKLLEYNVKLAETNVTSKREQVNGSKIKLF